MAYSTPKPILDTAKATEIRFNSLTLKAANAALSNAAAQLAQLQAGTRAADIYSLGKVLYEASTGMDRTRFPDLPTAIMDGSDSALLFQLNKIILRACETDVKKRYASATMMLDDLRHLQKNKTLRRRRFFWKPAPRP